MLTIDPSARPEPAPRRSRRQEELLDALEALAVREGFGQLTVGELAARLKCSRSTLYAIAPSKEELFLAVEQRLLDRVRTTALARAGAEAAPTARLLAFLTGAVETIGDVGPTYVAEIHAYAPARQLLAQFQRSTIEDLSTMLEEGIAAGAFQPVNTRLAAELLDAAASRIQDPRVLAETGLTAGQALNDVIRVIINGLLASAH